MNLKLIFLTSALFLTLSTPEEVTRTHLIKYVTESMKKKWRNKLYNAMTIHTKSPEYLTSTSLRLIQSIVTDFPTLVVNSTELIINEDSPRLVGVKKWLRLKIQQKSLYVLFVDANREKSLLGALEEFVLYLVRFSLKTTRPSCVIFIDNSQGDLELRPFFEFTWGQKFFDVIVIQLQPSRSELYTVVLHQFNPFNGTYYRHTLAKNSPRKLFVNKLETMYGYTLHTAVFDDVPMVMISRNHSSHDIWDRIFGMDVMITRTIAERLNFTPSIRYVYSRDPGLRRFNATVDEPSDRAFLEDKIDFAVNFYAMIGGKPVEDMIFECGIFFNPSSNNLIVKQYGVSGLKYFKDPQQLLLIFGSIVTTVGFFYLVSRLLNLDSKIWTNWNIAKILVGVSTSCSLSSANERILLISMTLVSSALSIQILQQLLEIYLWQNSYEDLTTLQDVIAAGIVPSITRDTKTELASSNYPALRYLLEHSDTLENEEDTAECIERLIHQRGVDACEVDSIVGEIVAQGYSDKERDWIITMIDEPLVQPFWRAMLFSRTSPYVSRFNRLLVRFIEAGLTNYWYDRSVQNFTHAYKSFLGEAVNQRYFNVFNSNYVFKSQKSPLNWRIVLILVVGHAVSCVAFVGEIVYYRYGCRNRVKNSMKSDEK